MRYLVPYVLFKVLLGSDIQAYTAVLEPFCLDLIIRIRYGRNDDIRESQALL